VTLTPEQWRDWLTHPCSKAVLSKILGGHLARQRTWQSVPAGPELARSQALHSMSSDLISYVKANSKLTIRDICTGAGVDPDQLPE
jgi:hypothetical protein